MTKLGFIGLILGSVAVGAETGTIQRVSWLDFDSDEFLRAWTAGRGASVASVVVEPVPGAEDGSVPTPSGGAMRLTAGAGGGAYCRAVPDGLDTACALSFWVRRVANTTAAAPEIEVQWVEPDGRSRFWRKVTLDQPGWQRVALPLRFFRTTGARLPEWSRVRHFALFARQAVTMDIDVVSIERADGCGPDICLRELRDVAFPAAATGAVRLVRDAEYAVMTDAAELDLPIVQAVLVHLTGELRRLFPFLSPPARPPVLIVFANRDEYRKFPGRIAERMGSVAREPNTDGYTIVGVATSYYDPQKGSLRPVYFHEFTHAWLSQAGGLACEGHWLHEAVANHMQLQLFPQSNFDELVRQSFMAGTARPLQELCSDRPVQTSDYWQLVTVFRMLTSKTPYAERLPNLFELVRKHSSFDLSVFLTDAFGVNWARLEADWSAYVAQAFRGASGSATQQHAR